MTDSDRELVSRFAQDRDSEAFVLLVERYSRLVRQVCRRVLRDEHLAEDASQATFLVLARQAGRLRGCAHSLPAWLHTVATNAALQMRRSRLAALKREQGYVEFDEPQTGLAELFGALDEELQRLPEADREAIVRCHLLGMTQEQAAAELAVSLSTLRRRLDRGIHMLRQRFARRGLWVPVIAVVWNSLASAGKGAEQSAVTPELIDSAVACGNGKWLRGGGVSRSVRNLSERVQTMSQRQRWLRAGGWFILVALLISSGVWPWLPTTHAGPPPTVASPGLSKVSGKPKLKSAPKVVAKSQGPTSTVVPMANPANGISALPSGAANSSSSSGSAFSGVMNINGREFRTADPAEFQRLLRMQQGMFPQLPFAGPTASAFQGAVNINGVEQKFSDPAAFQQAVQGLNLPIPLNLVK